MSGLSSTTRYASLGAVLLLAACIGPQGGAASGGAKGGTSPTALKLNAQGKGLVWDGEGIGGTSKGWSSCDKDKGPCKAVLEVAPGKGHLTGSALRFVGEGAGFLGGGWNWFGWWPADGGTDVSTFKHLSFWMKIEAASPKEAPDPGSLVVSLTSSKNNGKNTADELVAKFDTKLYDGQWHEIELPMSLMKSGKGSEFDPQSAWQFNIGAWSADPRKFTIYIDDIGFDNRADTDSDPAPSAAAAPDATPAPAAPAPAAPAPAK
ncbi:MAG TPA: hypothetical protein VGI10_09495 [Polyangiaceae bacterium]|jgi:hypothetical protein